MSELGKRILTAVVGIPAAVVIIYAGGFIFTGTVMLVSALALLEYYKITENKGARPHKILGTAVSLSFQFGFYFILTYDSLIQLSFIVLSGFIIFSLLVFSLELWLNSENAVINTSVTLGGILYISLPLSTLTGIREIHNFNWQNLANVFPDRAINAHALELFGSIDASWSAGFLLSLFAAVWICDSAAYFIGKRIGKNKLFPRVSPKKTWEGSFAGFIFGIISFLAFSEFLSPGFPFVHALVCGFLIGTVGQIGDLAESQLKRDSGVKDSSSVLPGHGGFLDRFDGIIFTAPAVFFYLLLITLF